MMDVSLFAFGFTHHRKVRKLSDAAFRLWVTAIDHANQDRSGGVVTDDDLDCYPRAPRAEARTAAVGELTSLGLWHELEPGRWEIHDFEEWQSRPAGHQQTNQQNGGQLDQQNTSRQFPTPQQLGGLARAAASRTPAGRFGPTSRNGPAGPAVHPADGPAEHQQNGVQLVPAGSCFPPHPLSDRKELESAGSESTSGSGDSDQPEGKGSGKSRRARRTKLPGHWEPTVEHKERAEREGLDIADQATRFRLHAEGTGRLMANWNAAFTTWLMNANRFAPRAPAKAGRARAADLLPDQLARIREQEARELEEALS